MAMVLYRVTGYREKRNTVMHHKASTASAAPAQMVRVEGSTACEGL
jgi:hypothetical protein